MFLPKSTTYSFVFCRYILTLLLQSAAVCIMLYVYLKLQGPSAQCNVHYCCLVHFLSSAVSLSNLWQCGTWQPFMETSWLHKTGSFSMKAGSLLDNQDIPVIVWNMEVHCRAQNCPTLAPVLRHINPVHDLPSWFINIHINIILPHTPKSSCKVFARRWDNLATTLGLVMPCQKNSASS